MRFRSRMAAAAALPVMALGAGVAACGETGSETSGRKAAPKAPVKVGEPLVLTYDGGVYVLDRTTLKLVQDLPLPGFNRVNAAGDDRHVLVSTAGGFRVLDAAGATLREEQFAAVKPGHVVRHAGKTVLFADGTGKVTVFDPRDLGTTTLPESSSHTAEHPHHGVAVVLKDGQMVLTLGTEDKRTGIQVLDAARKETARNEDCPGVHGESTVKDETVVIGCENGALVYKGGTITKVTSPDAYGRIGNQAGHEESPIVLGDYKTDPDAELERPKKVSLIDTRSGTIRLIDVKASYSFRSLGRGPNGEALILGTDGALRTIDPETGRITATVKVVDPWEEPLEWQDTRPSLHVRDRTAYVTDPADKKVHAVDIESGKVQVTGQLPQAPNELTAP
ncbi:zinc metallochaperone AztD [Actinomadura alba]|nr:zinc metallochaperone AztD [Actinomadura alba]